MKRADVLYYFDLSGEEEFVEICKQLQESKRNDTDENYKVVIKFVYNCLREIFKIDNVLELAHSEDMSQIVLFVYDCLASELSSPVECIVTETERYIEFE